MKENEASWPDNNPAVVPYFFLLDNMIDEEMLEKIRNGEMKDLRGVDLTGVDLTGADLAGPDGFTPPAKSSEEEE
jgi:hypothetical protein